MKLRIMLLFLLAPGCYAELPDASPKADVVFSDDMIPENDLVDDVMSMSVVVAAIAFAAYLVEDNEQNPDQENQQPHESCTIL